MSKKVFSYLCLFLLLLLFGCKEAADKNDSEDTSNGGPLQTVAQLEISSFNPRLVSNATDETVSRLLFSGLMRWNRTGELVPDLAKSVKLSDDEKTYTFQLKESFWSTGEPVTANDFLAAWRLLLTPFESHSRASELFPIQGAKEIVEGAIPLEDLEVFTPDSHTLVVKLVSPNSSFLEWTSSPLSFPIPSTAPLNDLDWLEEPDQLIMNGPFLLEAWAKGNILRVKKSPHYWGKEEIQSGQIHLYFVDEETALDLWHRQAVQWIGFPLFPFSQERIKSFGQYGLLHYVNQAALSGYILPINQFPLDSLEFRQALSLALNREAIPKLSKKENPLTLKRLLPPSLSPPPSENIIQTDTVLANKLLYRSLGKLGIEKKSLPTFALIYQKNERYLAEWTAKQWSSTLGINAIALSSDQSIPEKTIPIHLYTFSATKKDPLLFLKSIVAHPEMKKTGWNYMEAKALIEYASKEGDVLKKEKWLLKLEKILSHELPLLPLSFQQAAYVKHPFLQGYVLTPFGILDLGRAWIDYSSRANQLPD